MAEYPGTDWKFEPGDCDDIVDAKASSLDIDGDKLEVRHYKTPPEIVRDWSGDSGQK